MPMFHIAGDVVSEFGALARKGTFIIMHEFDPGLMLELFESERCNSTLIVPTMILDILNHPDREKRDCSSMVTIMSGAANVPAALINRTREAFGCNLCNMFGQTESNGPIAATSPADTEEHQTETVGEPLPHVEVKIVDPATEETVPPDAVGEIWVRGYQTMKGYFGLPEATAAALRPGGWLRTGDLGTMNARGYIRITGRLKEMIIRGGMNLYPKEIEDVLFSHPQVGQVSVVGVPDEKWGEVVAAVIQPKAGCAPSIDDLFSYCRASLSPQKTPVLWFLVDSFPLTSTGKIQKPVLSEWIAAKVIAPVNWTKPQRLVEREGERPEAM
jgi:fatty-acyl-CoA synthase